MTPHDETGSLLVTALRLICVGGRMPRAGAVAYAGPAATIGIGETTTSNTLDCALVVGV